MSDEQTRDQKPASRATGSETAADQSDAMKGKEPMPTEKPSQAEGDRETVEQDLRTQEERGNLL
jgi:hypothetical protein